MKNLFLSSVLILSTFFVQAQKAPELNKTEFDQTALDQTILDFNLQKTTVSEIFKKHEGKVILLDIWASWCADCIKGLPALEKVQETHPEVVYLFFSLDRIGKEEIWKNTIEKYNMKGEHYWFNTEWKNDFTNYIELNWVPRYLLIDQEGRIAHYYAIHADDQNMLTKLEELLQK